MKLTISRRVQFVATTLALGLFLLMPRLAWAHDEDDAPVPLTPAETHMQLTVLGVVTAAVVGFGVWYWWRRRQVLHSVRTNPPADQTGRN